MSTLKDTLTRWQEAADIDWFSQFIKAWIPFNAWMTHTFGDLTDKELLDHVRGPGNVVFNGIVPLLDPALAHALEDEEFRLHFADLNRRLQLRIINSRRGRVSFDTVDLGANSHKDEQQHA